VDIADGAVEEARKRVPQGTFFAGDALSLNLPSEAFDAVLTLETFSHVPSQPQFVELMARVLSKNGVLILTTQNRTVYTRRSGVRPPAEGQIRHWVTLRELRGLVAPHFEVLRLFTIQPSGDRGFLRVVNSGKINRAFSMVFSKAGLERFKERCGWGQTLVLLARKRA
jgi:ubiquinone/menaquinone biosynthesis C-methylase UbiE